MAKPTQKVFFISSDYVKENSFVEQNVDDNVIKVAIWKTQQTRLHPIVGTQLFEQLENEVINGTITGNTQTLMDLYISPYLLEQTIVEVLTNIWVKVSQSSVIKVEPDNTISLSLEELHFMIDKTTENAYYFSNRLSEYLCANTDLFPNYTVTVNSNDLVPDSRDVFQHIYLGNIQKIDKDCC